MSHNNSWDYIRKQRYVNYFLYSKAFETSHSGGCVTSFW